MVKDRIVLLDSLRGLAVLGILLCNIPVAAVPEAVATSLPLWPLGAAPASVGVWLVTQIFFQQKFYSLFAMLFGASILLVGGEGGDSPDARERRKILILRLVSLLAIGLVHGFVIWQGDVLNTYAIVGLLAMWARSWPAKRLLQAGIGLHLGISAWSAWGLLQRAVKGGGDPPPAALAEFLAATKTDTAQYAGTFAQSFTQNAHDYAGFVTGSFSWPPIWPLLVLSLMLMGMGLYKLGVFSGRASSGAYRGLIGVGLGFLAIVGLAEVLYTVLPTHPWPPRAMARWLQSATAPVVSLGYVGLMVMATRARIWKAIPAILAPVGQMAFTNYLAQSILMTTLLYGGRGPGLYGKVDRPFLAGAVAVIWLLQILWSRWWMARFTMGPLEWLWRLAYRGPMPLRRAPETAAATA